MGSPEAPKMRPAQVSEDGAVCRAAVGRRRQPVLVCTISTVYICFHLSFPASCVRVLRGRTMARIGLWPFHQMQHTIWYEATLTFLAYYWHRIFPILPSLVIIVH